MADAKRDGNYVTTLLAVSNVDGVTPVTLYANPTTHRLLVDLAGGGSGTVQTVAIASANGFAGTSDGDPSAPTLTISTTVTGILSGNGTAVSAAATTGSGSVVLATSPTLVTPLLGTPTSGTLTNCTGLPVATGISGLGTGVATALAVNVGSAGAFVVFDGALGTPSSGTVTNLTGTASININGTVGATTPSTATFTTATINTGIVPDANDGAYLGQAATGFSDLFFASGAVIGYANGDMTITHASGVLTIGNTATGAQGPILELYQDSATPAVSDEIANISFYGEDSAGNKELYARIKTVTSNVTSTTESGGLYFGVVSNGTFADKMWISGTVMAPNTNDGLSLGSTTNQYSDLFLAEGGVINWDNGDATLTQVGNMVTLAGADLTVPNITIGAAGVITLSENASLALDPAGSADGKYTGITIAGTAGATLAFGEVVYLAAADSRWELADADAASTSDRMLGICVLAAAADGDPTTLLLMGTIRADAKFPALTIGSPVYVGETAGAVQTAIPTGADNVIRRVGYALTADELYFNPSMDSQITVA